MKRWLVEAARAANMDINDPDPDLNIAVKDIEKAKWGTHSLRRFADKSVNQAEVRGAGPALVGGRRDDGVERGGESPRHAGSLRREEPDAAVGALPHHPGGWGLGNWQAVASSCVRAHRCRVWAGLALGADLFPLCYMI